MQTFSDNDLSNIEKRQLMFNVLAMFGGRKIDSCGYRGEKERPGYCISFMLDEDNQVELTRDSEEGDKYEGREPIVVVSIINKKSDLAPLRIGLIYDKSKFTFISKDGEIKDGEIKFLLKKLAEKTRAFAKEIKSGIGSAAAAGAPAPARDDSFARQLKDGIDYIFAGEKVEGGYLYHKTSDGVKYVGFQDSELGFVMLFDNGVVRVVYKGGEGVFEREFRLNNSGSYIELKDRYGSDMGKDDPILKKLAEKIKELEEKVYVANARAKSARPSAPARDDSFARQLRESIDYIFAGEKIESCGYEDEADIKKIHFIHEELGLVSLCDNGVIQIINRISGDEFEFRLVSSGSYIELKDRSGNIVDENNPILKKLAEAIKDLECKVRDAERARSSSFARQKPSPAASGSAAAAGAPAPARDDSFARQLREGIDYIFAGEEVEGYNYENEVIHFIHEELGLVSIYNNGIIEGIHRLSGMKFEFRLVNSGSHIELKDVHGIDIDKDDPILKKVAEKIKELEEKVSVANIRAKSARPSAEYGTSTSTSSGFSGGGSGGYAPSAPARDDSFARQLRESIDYIFSGEKIELYGYEDEADIKKIHFIHEELGLVSLCDNGVIQIINRISGDEFEFRLVSSGSYIELKDRSGNIVDENNPILKKLAEAIKDLECKVRDAERARSSSFARQKPSPAASSGFSGGGSGGYAASAPSRGIVELFPMPGISGSDEMRILQAIKTEDLDTVKKYLATPQLLLLEKIVLEIKRLFHGKCIDNKLTLNFRSENELQGQKLHLYKLVAVKYNQFCAEGKKINIADPSPGEDISFILKNFYRKLSLALHPDKTDELILFQIISNIHADGVNTTSLKVDFNKYNLSAKVQPSPWMFFQAMLSDSPKVFEHLIQNKKIHERQYNKLSVSSFDLKDLLIESFKKICTIPADNSIPEKCLIVFLKDTIFQNMNSVEEVDILLEAAATPLNPNALRIIANSYNLQKKTDILQQLYNKKGSDDRALNLAKGLFLDKDQVFELAKKIKSIGSEQALWLANIHGDERVAKLGGAAAPSGVVGGPRGSGSMDGAASRMTY